MRQKINESNQLLTHGTSFQFNYHPGWLAVETIEVMSFSSQANLLTCRTNNVGSIDSISEQQDFILLKLFMGGSTDDFYYENLE